jgi:hypothetical protein
MRLPLVLSLVLTGLLACAAEAAERVQYEGQAYGIDDGNLLYRESHYVDRDGAGSGRRVVLYRCPDGAAFARKRIDYGTDSLVPDFEMVDARLGYREGVRREGVARAVFVQRGPQREERSGPLPTVQGLVADAGFDDFVRLHWDQLAAGETLRFPILLPSRIDWFDFKVGRAAGESDAGDDTLVIRLSLGAWWAFLLPHVDVHYARERRELLRYTGITSVRDTEGRNYEARLEFAPDERRPLAAGALQAALEVPLASTCTG